MTEKMQIQDSKERVAFELAKMIAADERVGGIDHEKEGREYWLDLFVECREACYGHR